MAEQKSSANKTTVGNVWSCVILQMWRTTQTSHSWAVGSHEQRRVISIDLEEFRGGEKQGGGKDTACTWVVQTTQLDSYCSPLLSGSLHHLLCLMVALCTRGVLLQTSSMEGPPAGSGGGELSPGCRLPCGICPTGVGLGRFPEIQQFALADAAERGGC